MRKGIIICFLASFLGITDMVSQDAAIEERPANAPRGVVNARDELHRRQGVWSTYNNEGDLISTVEYVNNRKEGLTTIYYPGGGAQPDKIKEETNYFSGQKDGTSTKYYLSGQPSYEGSYNMGKKDGMWTFYYEDGQVKMEGNYVNGKKDGDWKWYNRKGDLIKSVTYKDGVDASASAASPKDNKGKGGKDDKKEGAKPGAAAPADKKPATTPAAPVKK